MTRAPAIHPLVVAMMSGSCATASRRLLISSLVRQQVFLRRNIKIQATSDEEKRLADILKKQLNASQITVKDISGGCGAMYEIFVESDDFKGKRSVMQHKMVNHALGEEVKAMHGLRIFTAIPGDDT